ncbi:MAG TPA: 30S ribosome-binding factor RbfA [Gemmatimonadota bacterium]|nr:30S ribosome-binding factor RbfA [Gemmatimonadota bacterium]
MARRTRRTARVDELLRERVAEVVREIKDPRVGFVTVMDVQTSPDLRHARVFVSVLGDDEDKDETLAALRHASGWVQGRVAEEVSLKFLPRLDFVLDRTLEKAARLNELIEEMRSDVGEEKRGGDDDDAETGDAETGE